MNKLKSIVINTLIAVVVTVIAILTCGVALALLPVVCAVATYFADMVVLAFMLKTLVGYL